MPDAFGALAALQTIYINDNNFYGTSASFEALASQATVTAISVANNPNVCGAASSTFTSSAKVTKTGSNIGSACPGASATAFGDVQAFLALRAALRSSDATNAALTAWAAASDPWSVETGTGALGPWRPCASPVYSLRSPSAQIARFTPRLPPLCFPSSSGSGVGTSVTCALTASGALGITKLGLNSVLVNGTLPCELGLLAFLTSLEVSSSYVSGLAISIATTTGAAPTSSISGTLPSHLGRLSSLQYLSLYGNGKISGPIPSQLGVLSKLTLLNLASDGLAGSVPSVLAKIGTLTSLSISGNANLCGNVSEIRARFEANAGYYFGRDGTGDFLPYPLCYDSTITADVNVMLSLRSSLSGTAFVDSTSGWFRNSDPCKVPAW